MDIAPATRTGARLTLGVSSMLEHIPSMVGITFIYEIAIAAVALLVVLLVISAILDRTGEARDRRDTEDVAGRVGGRAPEGRGETPMHRAA